VGKKKKNGNAAGAQRIRREKKKTFNQGGWNHIRKKGGGGAKNAISGLSAGRTWHGPMTAKKQNEGRKGVGKKSGTFKEVGGLDFKRGDGWYQGGEEKKEQSQVK